MASLVNPPKYFKNKLYQSFYKFFHKYRREGSFPNSFCMGSINLIAKPDKGITRKQNFRPASLINTDTKILKKGKQTLFHKECFTLQIKINQVVGGTQNGMQTMTNESKCGTN